MDYIDLYETRQLLGDLLYEAANYNAYVDKDGKPILTRKEFDQVVALDPTPVKTYAKWLLARYVSLKTQGDPEMIRRFFEDGYRITEALALFDKIKKKKPEGVNIDIMTYKSVQDLEAVTDRFTGQEDQLKSKSQIKAETKLEGAKKLFEDDHWLILIPLVREAAIFYGAGTKWCTAAANNSMFDYYTKGGGSPLIIIIDKDKERTGERGPDSKYQFHISSNQFMDARDAAIGYDGVINLVRKMPQEAQDILGKYGINQTTFELMGMFSYRNRSEKKINPERVRQLLQAGANPHIENEAILKWAVETGDQVLVDWLINDPNTSRVVLADIVSAAAAVSDFTTIQKIVGIVGPDAINANGAKALVKAATYPMSNEESQIYEKVKKAVKANSEAPVGSRRPPLEAIQAVVGPQGIAAYDALSEKVNAFYENAKPIIQYFVENGADVNSQNGEVLGAICKWSNDSVLQILEYLIQHGADVNINHSLAYWTAYNNFRPRVLKLLVAHGGKAA
jgi:hypothetical protein